MTTDASGAYGIWLPAGSVEVSARADGYRPSSKTVHVGPKVDFTLRR
jgi:hypothetical protein